MNRLPARGGGGAFETVEIRDGQPFALTRHLDRLERGLDGLGIRCPDAAELRRAVQAVCAAWGAQPGRLRITVTSGGDPMEPSDGTGVEPTLLITAGPMTVLDAPTEVLVVPVTHDERDALAGWKTTSYAGNVLALTRAEAVGASEALLANTAGMLCEGTGSNVFVELDGRLVTPPLSSGCLPGITRELLLDALDRAGAAAVVEDVPMDLLDRIDAMFLVSTGRHVQPVSRIGERRLPVCPGPLTAAAARIWHEAYDEVLDP